MRSILTLLLALAFPAAAGAEVYTSFTWTPYTQRTSGSTTTITQAANA